MINDKIKPTIRLTIILDVLLYRIIQVFINTIVYKIPLKSKYHIPILKQLVNIMNIIKILIIIDILFFLLLYQHIKASIGEIIVNPYHIIIYFLGLNPLNIIVYKW